ncbi:MAG: MATE family efflux transporter [Roseburia sp.]|nr:MATE family efflux transporter [Roseburia sp.]
MKEENKMAVMPVNRLMAGMGIPMIISMMLQAVYNIVDSAFVANMKDTGEMALNALTLAFPVQMLMVAVGVGTGVGINALLARSMGQGDREKASRTAGNGVFLMAVIYILFLLFGLFGTKGYVASQTQNEAVARMAADYLKICCVWSFGILFFSLYEKILQATGKSLYSTIAQVTGAVVNIILDPILIYGLAGFPEMGVRGAAYATVIGQIASALCGLILHLRVNREIENGLRLMKPSGNIIKGIYSIGFAAIIAQALMSIMTYLLNVIFVRIGENVVTAYGLYYKIQQFILFAAFGLRDAITPIVSFSHGMRSRERVKDGIRYGLLYTLGIMAIGWIGLEIFAEPFAEIFGLSGNTKALCVSAMRIISISYIFAGANIAFQGVFQALDGGLESLVISVCRQFLFVIPVAYLFTRLVVNGAAGTWLIWLTFPIGEALSAVVAVFFMKKMNRRKIAVM